MAGQRGRQRRSNSKVPLSALPIGATPDHPQHERPLALCHVGRYTTDLVVAIHTLVDSFGVRSPSSSLPLRSSHLSADRIPSSRGIEPVRSRREGPSEHRAMPTPLGHPYSVVANDASSGGRETHRHRREASNDKRNEESPAPELPWAITNTVFHCTRLLALADNIGRSSPGRDRRRPVPCVGLGSRSYATREIMAGRPEIIASLYPLPRPRG